LEIILLIAAGLRTIKPLYMKMRLVLIISILLAFTSCVTILQSLVTHDNIITDDRLEGVWLDPGSKNILVQKLMNSKLKNAISETKTSDHGNLKPEDSVFYSKLYVISYREKNLDYTWIAGMVKIKDEYYLNLDPEECLDNNGKDAYDIGKATSTIAKISWKNATTLVLSFLNGDHIKEIILGGMAQIKYEYDPLFETFVITASSRELELFLEKYGNRENLFKGGEVINLTRKN
jgi:hypothetical protein